MKSACFQVPGWIAVLQNFLGLQAHDLDPPLALEERPQGGHGSPGSPQRLTRRVVVAPEETVFVQTPARSRQLVGGRMALAPPQVVVARPTGAGFVFITWDDALGWYSGAVA